MKSKRYSKTVLEILLKAASAFFNEDRWKPGVQIAWLDESGTVLQSVRKNAFYVALHRFPNIEDPKAAKRIVVCNANALESFTTSSARRRRATRRSTESWRGADAY